MFFPGFFNEANRVPRRATPAPTYPSKPVRPHKLRKNCAEDSAGTAEKQQGRRSRGTPAPVTRAALERKTGPIRHSEHAARRGTAHFFAGASASNSFRRVFYCPTANRSRSVCRKRKMHSEYSNNLMQCSSEHNKLCSAQNSSILFRCMC